MKQERIKELMEQVGMPNSQALKIALEQAVNETEQNKNTELAARDRLAGKGEAMINELAGMYAKSRIEHQKTVFKLSRLLEDFYAAFPKCSLESFKQAKAEVEQFNADVDEQGRNAIQQAGEESKK